MNRKEALKMVLDILFVIVLIYWAFFGEHAALVECQVRNCCPCAPSVNVSNWMNYTDHFILNISSSVS